MSWNSIVGQQRVKEILINAIETGRIAHAYLFSGPDGVGKDAAAIEFAKVVNCETAGGSACDRCDSCLKFSSLQHPNLTMVFGLPVGKGEKSGDLPLAKLTAEDLENVRGQIRLKAVNRYHTIAVPGAATIKVNSIRDLKREASLTPYSKGKKVFIVIDAENMNDEASNALLKTLEEPTDDTLLILTTSHRDQLFSTVVSRCQSIRFDFLTEHEIANHLIEKQGIEPPRAMLIGRLAHGSLFRAFELLDVDLQRQREEVLEFLRTMYGQDVVQLATFLDQLGRRYERDELERFLQVLQFWVRDALCVHEGHTSIINIDQRESIERFAKMFVRLDYQKFMEEIEHAISHINKNAYIPLILTVLAWKIKKLLLNREQ